MSWSRGNSKATQPPQLQGQKISVDDRVDNKRSLQQQNFNLTVNVWEDP